MAPNGIDYLFFFCPAGSWIHVPPASAQAGLPPPQGPATPLKAGRSGGVGSSPGLVPGQAGGWQAVTDQQRLSTCALEVSHMQSVKVVS